MKSFKQILLEATKKKLERIDRAIDKTERRIANFGGLKPEHQDEFDLMHGMSPEYDPFEMADVMNSNPDHPDVKKIEKLDNALDQAVVRDNSRIIRIANKLRETNPKRYSRLVAQVKPEILRANQHRIDTISNRLEKLRSINAPKDLIDHNKKRLDTVSDSIGSQIHMRIGALHRDNMESRNRPR